jgi:hypothetical protein
MFRLVAMFALCALLFQTTAASAMPKHPEAIVPPGKTYVIYSHGKVVKRLRAGSNVAQQLPRGLAYKQCRYVECPGPPVILNFCLVCD